MRGRAGGRSIGWLALPVLGLLVASVFGITGPAAQAFPGDAGCVNNVSDVNFHFEGTWTTLARNAVRAGILDWNGRRDHLGPFMVNFVESADEPSIEVRHVAFSNGVYGQATCNWIEISSRGEYQTTATLRGIARHESGHVIGLAHTGDQVSFNGDNPPAMSTCHDAPGTNRISQDDVAAMSFDSSVADTRPFMANYSFANGLAYWGWTGAAVRHNTALGYTGSGYAEFEPTQSSDRIYQTVNFVHTPGAQSIRAQAAARRWGAILPNQLTLELWARDVDYAAGHDCANTDPGYVTGTNLNSATSTGVWSERRQLVAGMFGIWHAHETAPWTTYADGSQDVRVRFGSYANQPAYVDHLTVECSGNLGFTCTAP